jgi:hypothetical protein
MMLILAKRVSLFVSISSSIQSDLYQTHARDPNGGLHTFHQKATSLTQSTFKPCVVPIWSRNTLEFGVNDTLAVYRVVLSTPYS